MSVIHTNPELEQVQGRSVQSLIPGNGSDRSGRQALEGLLAFSSLQQQVQAKRHQSPEEGAQSAERAELEQFVLDEVLQLTAERALAITGADGVAIALADSTAIVCRASAGSATPDRGMRVDRSSGFSGACLSSGQIVRCDDSESDARVSAQACRNLGARSMVAVPLIAKQTVIGLLEAFSSDAYGFNDCDVRNLSLLAELILAALRPEDEDFLTTASQAVSLREGPPVPPAPEAKQGSGTPDGQESSFVEEKIDSQEVERAIEPEASPVVATSSRPGLGFVIALVLSGSALGGGLWWAMHHSAQPEIAKPSSAAAIQVPAPVAKISPAPVNQQPAAPPEETVPEVPATPDKLSTFPEVSGIRHWSAVDSSTVVIDMRDQVQYEVHRLANPDRIYFDLHDTRLAAELSPKTIEIGDDLIQRVRVAQPVPGITRVVLETKGASNFSVSLEPDPHRLVVELKKIGTETRTRSKLELFPMDHSGEAGHTAAVASRLRLVLDAGHGGWDLGTVGRRGLLEKDLVLDVVSRLGHLVDQKLGAEVIYTRKDDSYIPLEERAEIANLADADLFLSVHANYSDYSSARGVETYYTNTYSSIKARPAGNDQANSALESVNWTNVDIREKVRDSHRFADDIQHSLYSVLAAKNPGLPNRGVKEAQYVVLTGTMMPAVLAEISFVSSPSDENNLQSSIYRQRIAQALYQGIERYAAEFQREKMAKAQKMAKR
jgi:N-acetylmuramoyl-L-alanine amidase